MYTIIKLNGLYRVTLASNESIIQYSSASRKYCKEWMEENMPKQSGSTT